MMIRIFSAINNMARFSHCLLIVLPLFVRSLSFMRPTRTINYDTCDPSCSAPRDQGQWPGQLTDTHTHTVGVLIGLKTTVVPSVQISFNIIKKCPSSLTHSLTQVVGRCFMVMMMMMTNLSWRYSHTQHLRHNPNVFVTVMPTWTDTYLSYIHTYIRYHWDLVYNFDLT